MGSSETDKGWAWAIVAAITIINLATLPVQQCFGLIFAERFTSLGITTTQTSLILHLNGTITCSLGLISGPMMKRFSFRKVAFFGSLTVAAGICATAFAVSVPSIIITYCIIVGVGYGIMFPATTLAINTYFRKKRNIAMGFSVTLTGLGPIVMPLLIVVLLENYATTGTLLILASIAAHALIGASLLRPFKKEQIASAKQDNDKTSSPVELKDVCATRNAVAIKVDDEADVRNGTAECRLLNENSTKDTEEYARKDEEDENKNKTFFQKIAENLDLDLLKDNRYIAVVLGMGLSLVAETNYNALFPFVLSELSELERTSIATIMSIQAAFDIAGRLCVPILAQKAGWTSRNLYIISLLGSTLGRTILSTWGKTYIIVIATAVVCGLAKGTKAVFQALIIPDYVPLERLPAASGIQMVCNGILSISIGPIIGLVHDSTESYVGALHFTSILSLSCVVMWIIGGLWTFKGNSAKEQSIETKDNTPEL